MVAVEATETSTVVTHGAASVAIVLCSHVACREQCTSAKQTKSVDGTES